MSVVIVTGANSGIGLAISRMLAAEGKTVYVAGRSMERLEPVSSELQAAGHTAHALKLDVSEKQSCVDAVAEVLEREGRVDALINNAGVSQMKRFWDITPQEAEHTLRVNTLGPFYCTQAVAPTMMKQRSGNVITISSMAGQVGGVPFLSDYVASKFAITGLTQAMAAELGPYSIRVNAICPGFVKTPMQDREVVWEAELSGKTPEEVRESYVDATPLGRLSTPEDTANMVSFLLSEKANFITGASLPVNGGAYMTH